MTEGGGEWLLKPYSLRLFMKRPPIRGPRRRCSTFVAYADSFKTRPYLPLIRSAGLRSERFEMPRAYTRTIVFSRTRIVRRVSRRSWIEAAGGMTGEWFLSARPDLHDRVPRFMFFIQDV